MLQQIYPSPQHDYCYELNKDFQFAAAHYVPSEEAGKCRMMHGHTYYANVTVAGDELDATGFLVNFSIIKKLIHDRFDHTLLNDDAESFDAADPNRFPTTEVVARTICDIVQRYLDGTANKPRCLQVYLRETPTSYCVYRPKRNGRAASHD
ncbi:6-pyruvoyl trahydropterin synthase family protein [Paenibacillus soyae]|uniref:6-carboxy-5,6,7,8-tetrahydropterin synthase n=1 Tax=Paenibacillus soyae TaxID=2969249 RepID=A0A9X2MTE8_9BACL|nr:6-pyruvoyl tetrahydropterin synthase family protein [Paenibacillus soyae]MCR2806484.1 6-pyruvoyl tetrahydropterin synthase family protein [Paenibacillus soyae]